MFCSRCGVSLAEGAQFCVDCGHMVEERLPGSPASATVVVCGKCSQAIFPGAHFCSHCGHPAPSPTVVSVANSGAGAAAAVVAYDAAYLPTRQPVAWGKIALLAVVLAIGGAIAWLVTTDSPVTSQLKSYLTTAHAETITDGSIAIKPHGFAAYRIAVPEGAIDVGLTGQFEASGRADDDVEILVLTDSEFVVWQSDYATSPFYDSGKVAKADMQASLPSRAGTYYLVLSNKPSRVEKTVHVTAGLRYNTWVPDSLIYVKQKVWAWFE